LNALNSLGGGIMEPLKKKYCAGCKRWRILDEFHQDKSKRGLFSQGRQRLCKECKQEWRDQRTLRLHPEETRGRPRKVYALEQARLKRQQARLIRTGELPRAWRAEDAV
jgi:hypothetical protein